MKRIALFQRDPECSAESCVGIVRALSSNYEIKTFTIHEDKHHQLLLEFVNSLWRVGREV